MEMIICGVCGQATPQAFANAHHIRPQATGGTSVDETPLCAGCHQNVHAVASMLGGPRAAMAEDTVRAYYRDADVQRRCLTLAVEVARWMAAKRTGNVAPTAPHEDVELVIQVPAAVKKALTLLGNDMKDPASNRKLGLTGVARQIVCQFVLARYPALKEEIQKSRAMEAVNPQIRRGPEPSAAVKRSLKH